MYNIIQNTEETANVQPCTNRGYKINKFYVQKKLLKRILTHYTQTSKQTITPTHILLHINMPIDATHTHKYPHSRSLTYMYIMRYKYQDSYISTHSHGQRNIYFNSYSTTAILTQSTNKN